LLRFFDLDPTLRVAYQGEPGAFSEEAIARLGPMPAVPCRSFRELFSAISDRRADLILVPIENTIAGPILECQERLAHAALSTIREISLPIRLQLVGLPNAALENVRRVRSHPVALAQCSRYFSSHPNFTAEPATDTAGSVREILELADSSIAAIASERAALHYGALILDRDVHDNPENFTRFLLLAPRPSSEDK
jgi:prephenate dehydratase